MEFERMGTPPALRPGMECSTNVTCPDVFLMSGDATDTNQGLDPRPSEQLAVIGTGVERPSILELHNGGRIDEVPPDMQVVVVPQRVAVAALWGLLKQSARQSVRTTLSRIKPGASPKQ